MGDGIHDWPSENFMFSDSQFNDAFVTDSPYNSTAFQDFTNMDTYGESPGGLTMRSAKLDGNGNHVGTGLGLQTGVQGGLMGSADSPSQDSSSESSSHLKRKTTESPLSDPMPDTVANAMLLKQDDLHMMQDLQHTHSLGQTFTQPLNNLSLEQGLRQFDFNSAASSPTGARDINMSLNAQIHMPAPTQAIRFTDGSPIETINPGMFSLGNGADVMPGNPANLRFGNASPNAMFSASASQSPEAFNNATNWTPGLAQNPNWSNEFPAQLTSTGVTPSPKTAAQLARKRNQALSPQNGMSPLHVAPISAKSRVETQINVVMTLENPPPSAEYLHLPLHTIAKSKLLAKEEYDPSKVLELHTMLVCTSAMHNAKFKEKALEKARAQSNAEIQVRAKQARDSNDEDRNDPKNVAEADRPANGGEVRICSNCIQRERKRAGRKKTKREEEQQHWERFETERVVVFNSNEYLPFKECGPMRDAGLTADGEYVPPEGALQVAAAMRIACYCRHQSEKEGFRVIFTLKDNNGNVIAQQISDSILITDDHKTHPQSYTAPTANDTYYQNSNFNPHGLPASHSMVDVTAPAPTFTSSRSAGNLQSLAFNGGFTPNGHVHQMQGAAAYSGQTTPTAVASASTSRPGSPSSAGQLGPNKKRKSSTNFHRKIPSGLTMTPRVDTSQPPSSNMASAVSQFSPVSAGFAGQMTPSMMNANGGTSAFYSGPPTPSDNQVFNFNQSQVDNAYVQTNQAYFSHPSSAVPSRANSPVLHTGRGNMAAYARQQHPIQTPTNTASRPPVFHSSSNSISNDLSPRANIPVFSSCIPDNGAVAGSNEVAIIGENFVPGMQVMFGETVAPLRFVSSTTIIATAPASTVLGPVPVTIGPPPGSPPYPPIAGKVYRYTQNKDEFFLLALKQLFPEKTMSTAQWWEFVRANAAKYMQAHINPAGLQAGYPGSQR